MESSTKVLWKVLRYTPYHKPNDKPLYINRLSNHPPSILIDISHEVDVFRDAASLYNKSLRESGYTNDVQYVAGRKNKTPVSKRKCVRKVIWFNPPFSKNLIPKAGQKFLKLIDKHFPVGSKLQKVFNQNTVKVSYSCMPSMGSITKQHNVTYIVVRYTSSDKLLLFLELKNCRTALHTEPHKIFIRIYTHGLHVDTKSP